MRTGLILVFVVAVVLSATSNSFAAIYKYTDQYGIICFANDLQSVPEQYRATAEIVKTDEEGARNPALQKQPPVQAKAKPGKEEPSADRGKASIANYAKIIFSGRALISVVVVVSALFAFVILGILDAEHRKSIKIVRVVILWGMSVYLIAAHGGDVVNSFKTLKGEVDMVQRESGEKGKKAAKAIREINAVIQQADDAASPESGGAGSEKRE